MNVVAVLAVAFGIVQVVMGTYVFNANGATFSCLNDNVSSSADDAVVFEYAQLNASDTYMEASIKGFQTNSSCREVVNNSTGVITLNVAVGNCGLTANAQNYVSVHILLVQTSGFVTEWDYKYYFHCNFNETTVQNVTAHLTNITHVTQNGTVTQKVENVTLTVVDNTTATPINTCALGDNVRLRLALAPSSSAVGTYGISCIASPDAAKARTLNFITDRCAVATPANRGNGFPNFQGYLPPGTGFGRDVVQTPLFLSSTESFKCFRFSDSDSLYFHCKVGFCSVRDNQCDDVDNCSKRPAGRRRRRREVDESETQDLIFRLDISSGSTARIATPARNEPSSPAECKPEHIYMYNTAFIAVIAILAVLLVVSMGSTMFVCMRMRRVRTGDKGEDNPAF